MKLSRRTAIQFACMLASAALVSACGADRLSSPPASDATGAWRLMNTVPGSSEFWTLAISGTSISGSGNWSGEACCGGTLDITGTAVGDSLHLDIVYTRTAPTPVVTPYNSIHMDAALSSETELVGIVRGFGADHALHYQRLKTD